MYKIVDGKGNYWNGLEWVRLPRLQKDDVLQRVSIIAQGELEDRASEIKDVLVSYCRSLIELGECENPFNGGTDTPLFEIAGHDFFEEELNKLVKESVKL